MSLVPGNGECYLTNKPLLCIFRGQALGLAWCTQGQGWMRPATTWELEMALTLHWHGFRLYPSLLHSRGSVWAIGQGRTIHERTWFRVRRTVCVLHESPNAWPWRTQFLAVRVRMWNMTWQPTQWGRKWWLINRTGMEEGSELNKLRELRILHTQQLLELWSYCSSQRID